MRMMRTRPVLLCIVLLGGCAAGQSSYAARPEPDCSFRSAATCWTIAGRFPSRRPAAATPKPDQIRRTSPSVLASKPDSTRGSR